MPLTLVVHDDAGHTGRALRRHRGEHALLGEGQCRRLASLLPAHCKDNGTHAEIPFRVAAWLALPMADIAADMRPIKVWAQMVGVERMGKMLDTALAQVRGDDAIPLPVLRGSLRGIAMGARDGTNADDFVVKAADLYEVATAFPTGPGIDDEWDFFGHVTYNRLLDSGVF